MANAKKDESSNQPRDIYSLTVFVSVNEHGVARFTAVKGAKGEATRIENVESRNFKRFRQQAAICLESVIDQVENANAHYQKKASA